MIKKALLLLLLSAGCFLWGAEKTDRKEQSANQLYMTLINGKRTIVSSGDPGVAAAIFTAGNRSVLLVANRTNKSKTVYVKATGRRMLMPLCGTAETNGGLIPLKGNGTALYEIR